MPSYKFNLAPTNSLKNKKTKNTKPLQVRTSAVYNFLKASKFYKKVLPVISLRKSNNGSATLEATIIMPIFIFAVLTIIQMGKILIVEEQIYQGMMDTAAYMAEYAYLYKQAETKISNGGEIGETVLGYSVAHNKFNEYVGENNYINQYVENGKSGISFMGSEYLDKDDFVNLKISYKVKINIPLLGNLSANLSSQVRQKAFIGYNYNEEMVKYVYVAEEGDVYHDSRSCSHILLDINQITKSELEGRHKELNPCKYCGSESNYSGEVYITADGNCYHYSRGCSGLKRTVRRVKLSEIGGLRPCSRCVD